MPYKLSATLAAHTGDVRAVASPTNSLILSASRDTTAVTWTRASADDPFVQGLTLRPGARYINAVAYIPPSPDAPEGYVVTGGQDAIINVFSLASGREEPYFSLIGHVETICTLDVSPDGTIVSGSWDKTAKVWKNFQLAQNLVGHDQSVWAVLIVGQDKYLTGSADNTIQLWHAHKAVRKFSGHTQAVRGLALIPDIGFASCSNDSEIRVWTLEGDTVFTLSGHTSFVYSLSVLPNGDIISGGEDRTVRIWRDGECTQVITHPDISVWCVSSMPNGDIVSGCGDGNVRVFSAVESRWASAEQLKAYDDLVASTALPVQQVGDVEKSDLPGVEVLSQPDNESGEVNMFWNEGDAYQWGATAPSWQKISDVVDTVGSGRKQLFKGKEYDYVFDVDIVDGAPPLKFTCNASDNLWVVAQNFLEGNDLSLKYLDEVVNFIERSIAGGNIGGGNNQDPSTGDSASSVGLPVRDALSFKSANVRAVRGKVRQFNEALEQEVATAGLAMHLDELSYIEDLFLYLTQAVARENITAPRPAAEHIEALTRVLDKWPTGSRFPLIDLSRLVIGYCPFAFEDSNLRLALFGSLFKAAEIGQPWRAPLPNIRETNVLLLLRATANAFQDRTTLARDGHWAEWVFEKLYEVPYTILPNVQRLTLATTLFNLSCVGLREELDYTVRELLVTMVIEILESEKGDLETAYRALVALGNTVCAATQFGNALDSQTQVPRVRRALDVLPKVFPEDRIRNMSRAIAGML